MPGVLGLEIVRHYNSAYSTPNITTGILGRGWKLLYETTLYATGVVIQIIQADGKRNRQIPTPYQFRLVEQKKSAHSPLARSLTFS